MKCNATIYRTDGLRTSMYPYVCAMAWTRVRWMEDVNFYKKMSPKWRVRTSGAKRTNQKIRNVNVFLLVHHDVHASERAGVGRSRASLIYLLTNSCKLEEE